MSDEYNPFVLGGDPETILIDTEYSLIHVLILFSDGFTVTQFEGEDKAYLKLTDVINWHEKELRETKGKSGSREGLQAFKTILEKFQRGEIKDEE